MREESSEKRMQASEAMNEGLYNVFVFVWNKLFFVCGQGTSAAAAHVVCTW